MLVRMASSTILLQHTPQTEDYRVVAYSSRALQDTESCYSLLEKKCRAIIHVSGTFFLYVLGPNFEVFTNHITLVSILNDLKSTLPLCIECWSWRLQGFNFHIRHINESFNPADYFSWHTVPDDNNNTSSTRIIEKCFFQQKIPNR